MAAVTSSSSDELDLAKDEPSSATVAASARTAGPPAAKRAMFEQLAMVGTFMVVYREHLNRQPSPGEEVNFRNAAKANLEAGLGLAVERLQIGPQGLVVR